MRAHHGSLKWPIWQEAGEFQSLVDITVVASLPMPTGPVRLTEALGLCSGTLRQPHLPLCFPKPIPKALSQQVTSCPRLGAAQLSFLFPFSSQDTLMALGMYCPSPCLLLPLGSSLLSGWRGSDACASSRPSLGACPALCGRTGGGQDAPSLSMCLRAWTLRLGSLVGV